MAAFDPYREWLDIQDDRRPPDHYALLGLQRYEQDPDQIRRSADARKSAVRSIRPGPHAAEWQRLLDEIEAARSCLLSETDKQAYDRQLREQPTEHGSVFENRADQNSSTATSSLIAETAASHPRRAMETDVSQRDPAMPKPVTNPLPPSLDAAPVDVGQPEPPETTPVESLTKNLLPPSLDTPSPTTANPAAGSASQVSSARVAGAGPTAVRATADSRSAAVSSAPDGVTGASPPGKLLMPPGLATAAGAERSGAAAGTTPAQERPGLTLPPASGEAGPTLTSSLTLDQLLPPMAQPAGPADSLDAGSVPVATPVALSPSMPMAPVAKCVSSEPDPLTRSDPLTEGVAGVAADPDTATSEPQIAEPESSSATVSPAFSVKRPAGNYRRQKKNPLVNLAVVVGIGILVFAVYAIMPTGSVQSDKDDSIGQVALNGNEESHDEQAQLNGNDQPDQGGMATDVGPGDSVQDAPETQNESPSDTRMSPEDGIATQNGPTVTDPDPMEDDWTPGAALDPSAVDIRPEEGDTDPQPEPDGIDPQLKPDTIDPQLTPDRIDPQMTPDSTDPQLTPDSIDLNPPPTEPDEPEPPELTEAQRTELDATLDEVKSSLAKRDLVAARRSMGRATALASEAPGPHEEKVSRMSLLCDYVHDFWDAVREGMPGVEGKDLEVKFEGKDLEVKKVLIHVVEANEQGIRYRYRGKNYRKAFFEMPAELVLAIGEQWLEDTPTSRIFVGAFMAVDPKFGPKKAREEWQAALQGGAEVEELIPILKEL